MKTFIFALALVAATPATAQVYGTVRGGEDTYGAALGADTGLLRFELGAAHVEAPVDYRGLFYGSLDAADFSVSAFADLPLGDRLSVFAGAGVDYLYGDGEVGVLGFSIPYDVNNWGYSLAAGGALRIAPGFTGEVQFRRLTVDDLPNAPASERGHVEHDSVTLGARIAFGAPHE